MKTSTLYITATPIGNLDDISNRALNTLEEVELVLCEDTRETQKLLNHYEIDTKTTSYHQNTRQKKILDIYKFLQQGNSAALVSDAGTPGISDPGGKLVEFITQKSDKITITPIPGPSAVTASLSISGFPANEFVFLGFPPHKKGRTKFFKEMLDYDKTVVFYESKHRVDKAINKLNQLMSKSRKLCICRELTKKFETIYRGTIDDIINQDITTKGEFTFVLDSRV